MSRASVTAAIQTWLEAMSLGSIVTLIEFETLERRYVLWKTSVTWNGETWSPVAGEYEGLSESIGFEAPSGFIRLTSLDASLQADFQSDEFRGDNCIIRILKGSSIGTSTAAFWTTTYTVDSDDISGDELTIKLGSKDVVNGSLSPRITTREIGCQRNYKRGGCPYRAHVDPVTGKVVSLASCDRGLHTPNGCIAHFPDLIDSSGNRVQQHYPYLALPGSLSRSARVI